MLDLLDRYLLVLVLALLLSVRMCPFMGASHQISQVLVVL
jgi:hypothetical protein